MKEDIMLSTRPEWCEPILNRFKTLELRKSRPKLEPPFTVFLYCTHGQLLYRDKTSKEICLSSQKSKRYLLPRNQFNGYVCAQFTCDDIDKVRVYNDILYSESNSQANKLQQLQMSIEDVKKYLNGEVGYIWHISDLMIYELPQPLSYFYKTCKGCAYETSNYSCLTINHPCKAIAITTAPQSWCYCQG